MLLQSEERIEVWRRLEQMFPDAHCELDYGTPFELVVAAILSAQCTDKRVNIVTKQLFGEVGSVAADYAALSPEQLYPIIKPCGLYTRKALSIVNAARQIMDKHGGEVPNSFDELLAIDGIGRKIANVVYAEVFGGDVIAVDTHVFRVSNRLGLVDEPTPERTERALCRVVPAGERRGVHHRLIFLGRNVCKAQSPDCGGCALNSICIHGNTTLIHNKTQH